MNPRIVLEPLHIEFAEHVAWRRQIEAEKRGRQAHNGAPVDRAAAIAINMIGAKAEAAAKLFLNPIRWNALSDKIHKLPDLGTFIDVKATYQRRHDLIVQKDDPDHWAYLSVWQCKPNIFDMVGWCWGYEAKQQRFWRDPAGGRAAFFVSRKSPFIKAPGLLSQVGVAEQSRMFLLSGTAQ